MKKLLNALLTLLIISLMACSENNSSEPKIGIIVPIEHAALKEIIAGFSDAMKEMYPNPVRIKVANAQGDANLQRAIIQQMRDQHYTLIVPIGLSTTQMAVAMVHNKPIVGVAAELSEAERQQQKPCNIAIVHDEIPPETLIHFIHLVYPQLTQLTLIHSTSEKVFPDVKKAIAAGKTNGITIKPLMVSTLPELYTTANALPDNTQGLFLLKDHLIVSGIATLAKVAGERHIPIITSDQGSVQDGATFGLGVYEREIGVEGAKLAIQILQGKSACSLPITDMKNLTVFINAQSLKKDSQSLEPIKSAAKKLDYTIEVMS